jgi:hypothetical protein
MQHKLKVGQIFKAIGCDAKLVICGLSDTGYMYKWLGRGVVKHFNSGEDFEEIMLRCYTPLLEDNI